MRRIRIPTPLRSDAFRSSTKSSPAGNSTASLISKSSVRRTDDFDISDAVLLPAGELLVLERKASLRSGVGIRIRRIALNSIAPGAVVDGPSIFDADLGQ